MYASATSSLADSKSGFTTLLPRGCTGNPLIGDNSIVDAALTEYFKAMQDKESALHDSNSAL